MNGTCYTCGDAGRKREVLRLASLNGIDFIEVLPGQTSLAVTFLFPLPGEAGGLPSSPPAPALTRENFAVTGGERIQGIEVIGLAVAGKVATLFLDAFGDFSSYTLRLRASATQESAPAGFDPRLSGAAFSFKVACPDPFDCLPGDACPPEAARPPAIDYLARDFSSFRRLMLDRLRVLMPGFSEQNPADPLVTLVEVLAYEGDKLAYAQDAVAAEAYLGTARRRISVRRHARLLEYRMHEGCAARAFVHFEMDEAASLPGGLLDIPAGTGVLTRLAEKAPLRLDRGAVPKETEDGAVVFESLHALAARPQHNRIPIYTWDDEECCLPAGSTRLTLRDDPSLPLQLRAGDFLLLEEALSPTTGEEVEADLSHRQVVRLTEVAETQDVLHGIPLLEVAWDRADALNFPLCVSARAPAEDGGGGSLLEVAVARGNMALVEHGFTRSGSAGLLSPVVVPGADPDGMVRYQPELLQPPLVFAVPYLPAASAAACLAVRPDEALPALHAACDDGINPPETFTPRFDLLNSGPFDRNFCVEAEDDGRLFLRFGDGLNGAMPRSKSAVSITYRQGGGASGNVGAESLSRVVTTLASPLEGLAAVRNPLAAAGGADRESAGRVKLLAPSAFKTQRRCVTDADYAERASTHPEVQKAVAETRWTGSWHTVFLSVDRKGGSPVDARFREDLLAHLEPWRMAGVDLELRDPVHVAVDIGLRICVLPDRFRSDVHAALLRALGSGRLPTGPGFFHPDRYTFGQALYLSQLIAAALAVPGVEGVEAVRLQRFGSVPAGELESGVLKVSGNEIVRCDQDPSFPERGRLALDMKGGR